MWMCCLLGGRQACHLAFGKVHIRFGWSPITRQSRVWIIVNVKSVKVRLTNGLGNKFWRKRMKKERVFFIFSEVYWSRKSLPLLRSQVFFSSLSWLMWYTLKVILFTLHRCVTFYLPQTTRNTNDRNNFILSPLRIVFEIKSSLIFFYYQTMNQNHNLSALSYIHHQKETLTRLTTLQYCKIALLILFIKS